jgi:hypothetical protein
LLTASLTASYITSIFFVSLKLCLLKPLYLG